ncbi:hypothetical protein [Myceligenerans pegani]|uniref:Uncharacterized protein n=1 Tax=Myceligenerans pegani TaxID=2776917 RepID=A0ABR9MY47_9MICO|nr:hypothetical protein [Myceligenerans sp. TRM 65318]MBE1876301.1 hypothetical protein [Myceligenerans sp. TRM 65318]MBE3018572.1 hypothetical protein [Myceligenerans sp. TRM 65318]
MEFILTLILIVLFVILVINVTGNLGPSAKSLRRLERRFDLLLDHLGVAEPGAAAVPAKTLAKIDELIANNMMGDARRIYREVTGTDPDDAAAWVRQRAESRAGS